jgi:hypothetical protein
MDTSEATYNVIINGELLPGFESQQVKDMFGQLFKLPPEKTARLLDKRRILKRDVDITKANNLKKNLERIGLVVTLESNGLPAVAETKPIPNPNQELNTKPKAEAAQLLGLSLVPMDKEEPQDTDVSIATVACPKCGADQPANNEECQGCGVYLHKAISRASEYKQTSAHTDSAATNVSQANGLNTAGIITGVVAALVGALIWKGIAMMFGIELGIIAWGIGGAIGFVMAVSGGRGQTAAVVCGMLALLAIMGGKYMVYSELQSQVSDVLAESSGAMYEVYENELKAAKAYTEVRDEQELRQFMVDYAYTDSSYSEDVTADEIAEFHEHVESRLKSYAYTQPDYDEWYKDTIEDDLLQNLSPMGVMKESFGLIDLLFLFLGVTTAARLGYGSESS